jgi:hypothetical protein
MSVVQLDPLGAALRRAPSPAGSTFTRTYPRYHRRRKFHEKPELMYDLPETAAMVQVSAGSRNSRAGGALRGPRSKY